MKGLAALVTAAACALPAATARELEHFAFTGYCDTDAMIPEASYFSDLCMLPLGNERLANPEWVRDMLDRDLGMIIGTHDIFFSTDPDSYGQLYPDFRERWEAAIAGKELAIAALTRWFSLADEPNWTGVSIDDIAIVHHLVKEYFPLIDTAVSLNHVNPEDWFEYLSLFKRNHTKSIGHIKQIELEVWLEGKELQTDDVCYHQYATLDPRTDAKYQENLRIIKEHAPGKDFIIVMDAWNSVAHRQAGIMPEDMHLVAQNYYDMARDNPDIIAIVPFIWQSLDSHNLGARDLPEHVQREYRRMGAEITGKCALPDYANAQHALFFNDCAYYATMQLLTAQGEPFGNPIARSEEHGEFHTEGLIGAVRLVPRPHGFSAWPAFYTYEPAEIVIYENGNPDPVKRFVNDPRVRSTDAGRRP